MYKLNFTDKRGKITTYTLTSEDKREYNEMLAKALENANKTPEDYQKAMNEAVAKFKDKKRKEAK